MNDAMGMPQTAVVLGGSSEIARAVLRALATTRLRHVVLAGRDEVSLAAAAKELEALGTDKVETRPFDVTDVEGHGAFARETAERLGHVDLVLVAAGVLGDQSTDEHDPLATARVLTTNTVGPAAAMVAFADVLRAQGTGRMVVLSSVAGVRVRRANFVYGASKAGLDGFAQGLAESLRGSGAGLMIVRPGWVATRMTAGREPGPMATTPDAVAADVVRGLERGAATVWSPAPLKFVFALLRLLPAALWRRLPG
ncbi:MAG TPA: SDR family NAD(P)-dependent oxidoreductase [Acidimicrobiales bacterium]|nr:SDR family NAD(P)-dependent oxidoreductase [Acidimicrobiales bacterium]